MVKLLQIALRTVGIVVMLLGVTSFVITMISYMNIDNPIIQPWNIGNLIPSVTFLFFSFAVGLLCLFADYKLNPYDVDTDPSVFGDKE